MVRLNSVHLSYWVQQMNVSYGHTSGFQHARLAQSNVKGLHVCLCRFQVRASIGRYITIVLPMQKYCLHG